MKECLQCKKQFEAKREDTAKFCSTNCRVKWNRKNGKKNTISKIDVQVLFNQMVDMMSKMNVSQQIADRPYYSNPQIEEKPKMRLKRTPAHWVELRRDCDDADSYAKWLDDLENDPHLTLLEKSQIKQTI